MAIDERISSIITHLENAYTKISSKGGTLPINKNFANLESAINSIETGGVSIQLNAPTLSFGTSTTTSDPLIITNAYNGNFVESYDIYEGTNLLTNIFANLTSNTINLRDYISVDGTYTIKVVAKGSSFLDSNAATIIYVHETTVDVTNLLTHCTTSNLATETEMNQPYSATLTEASGYSFVGATVSIYMGGVDITSTAYDGKRTIYIAQVTGDISIIATFAAITILSQPTISLSGSTLTINPVPYATHFVLCLSGEEWQVFEADKTSIDFTTKIDLSEWLTLNDTYQVSVKARADGYLDSNESSSVYYTESNGDDAEDGLENIAWTSVRLISESGYAGDYWNLGDTKTDLGTNGVTRTFQIVDMSGMYGKNVVFSQVELEPTKYKWNNESNKDDERYSNNYSISTMRTQTLPSILLKYSDDLQRAITPTTHKVLKNGYSVTSASGYTYLTIEDKIFLPTLTELGGSVTAETANGLVAYSYYSLAGNTARTKKFNDASSKWWTATPYSDMGVMFIWENGDTIPQNASMSAVYYTSYGLSTCFVL